MPQPMDQEGWQRLKARFASPFIEEYRVLYLKHQNPTHGLAAYRVARAAKIEVPEWVFQMLDRWAEVLCVERPRGAKAIASGLSLLGHGGGPSVTFQAETQVRNLRISQRIHELYQEGSLEEAFEVAGAEFNLTPESVRDIWYEFTRSSA